VGERKVINPPELFDPPGFSHVIVASGQRLISVAGQTALGTDFSIVGADDLVAQTKAAMESVGIALKAAGADWGDVIRRTIYTLSPTQFEAIGNAMQEVTGESEPPAQTILGVTALAVPGLLIEIEVTALVD
jgi:enamine deaminase RidA (YjgF/YER057c/UK114 family)